MKYMKKRLLAIFFTIALLVSLASVSITALAEDVIDVSLSLDKSAKEVTITASGFSANQMVSILGYVGEDTGFVNPDYIGQATADAEGKFVFAYPSKATSFDPGSKITVKLNGVNYAQNVSPVVSVTPKTENYVVGYAANVTMVIEGDLSGMNAVACVAYNGEILGSAPIVKNISTVVLPSTALSVVGKYDLLVKLNDVVSDVKGSINVVSATSIWDVALTKSAEGTLDIGFIPQIQTAAGKFSVDVGSDKNVSCKPVLAGATKIETNVNYDGIADGTSVVVKGVKFPTLFPAYSFTFSAQFSK